jgi:predicted AAA+ superfamily ATPase
MYRRLGDDVPRDVREPAYREKLRRAYPFHPEVIDTLFERWSTYPTFQRTRGALRFLAEVVADLYQQGHSAPLIQPAHINLAHPAIRRELLKHIGNEYEGVIASDIADGNAKARQIEREMGSEYARFQAATGLATAIFFGSFSGAERKGVSIQRLRLAFLREGIPSALVGDTLKRLEAELWYLHVEGGSYWFSSQPNLNRILVEREETSEKRGFRRNCGNGWNPSPAQNFRSSSGRAIPRTCRTPGGCDWSSFPLTSPTRAPRLPVLWRTSSPGAGRPSAPTATPLLYWR